MAPPLGQYGKEGGREGGRDHFITNLIAPSPTHSAAEREESNGTNGPSAKFRDRERLLGAAREKENVSEEKPFRQIKWLHTAHIVFPSLSSGR